MVIGELTVSSIFFGALHLPWSCRRHTVVVSKMSYFRSNFRPNYLLWSYRGHRRVDRGHAVVISGMTVVTPCSSARWPWSYHGHRRVDRCHAVVIGRMTVVISKMTVVIPLSLAV